MLPDDSSKQHAHTNKRSIKQKMRPTSIDFTSPQEFAWEIPCIHAGMTSQMAKIEVCNSARI